MGEADQQHHAEHTEAGQTPQGQWRRMGAQLAPWRCAARQQQRHQHDAGDAVTDQREPDGIDMMKDAFADEEHPAPSGGGEQQRGDAKGAWVGEHG